MDPSSSSVGFPLSGNPQPQSSQNPTPLHPPSGGISHSGSSQATISSSTSNSSSSTAIYCNGPPTSVLSSKDWNEEMTKLFPDDNFREYMCGGECQQPFRAWYSCMHNVIDYHNGNRDDCTHFAGALRDCVFANLPYYKPLLSYFSDRARWSSS